MLLPASLEEYVDHDNEVRAIDLFVNNLHPVSICLLWRGQHPTRND